MLTTTATIVFLLVASSLAALAVHEWLGGSRRRSSDSSEASLEDVDALEDELRSELHTIQRKLVESRAALTEESHRLESLVVQSSSNDSVRPAIQALEGALMGMQARSQEIAEEIERRGQSCIQAGAQHESAIAASFSEARTGQAELRGDLEQLSRSVAGLSAQIVDVERAAVQVDRIDAIESSVEGLRFEVSESSERPSVDVDRVAAIEESLRSLQSDQNTVRMDQLEEMVMELMGKVDSQPSITVFESRIEGLEVQCAELVASRVSEDRLAQIEQSLYSQDMRLCTLEDDFQSMESASAAMPVEPVSALVAPVLVSEGSVNVTDNERDDLKKIKGIGIVIEQTLNSVGIESFEQVANLTIDQIEELSEHLGAFASRVERDQWVAQARALVG